MRTYPFALAAILAVAIASPSRAEKPRPAQANQQKKVWTNEDVDQLRARGLISYFTPAAGNAPEAAATSQAQPQAGPLTPESKPLPPKLQDPEWYRQQAEDLQMQLDEVQAELQLAETGLTNVKDRITQPGVALDRGNVGITPEAGIDIREAQVREIQAQLDDLADLARQNNIPPGVLRV